MKAKLKGYRSFNQVKKKWMKDPEFVREWEKLEPEYQLARSLIGARIKGRITQEELAKRVGTKQPVISRIEAMSSSPSVSLLKRVADALGMKLDIRFSYK